MSTSQNIGVSEAANRIGLTRRGVLAAIERGDLVAERLGHGRSPYIIKISDLDNYVAKRAGKADA